MSKSFFTYIDLIDEQVQTWASSFEESNGGYPATVKGITIDFGDPMTVSTTVITNWAGCEEEDDGLALSATTEVDDPDAEGDWSVAAIKTGLRLVALLEDLVKEYTDDIH